MNENPDRIEAIFDLARREINRQRPMLALECLRGIADELPNGTPNYIEYLLIVGQALDAQHDPNAEGYLLRALDTVRKVPSVPVTLILRVHEGLGDFYVHSRVYSKALHCYEDAKSAAVSLRVSPRTAEIELKIVSMNLQIDEDERLGTFKTLRHIASTEDFSWEDQLMAWHLILGDSALVGSAVRFARKYQKPSEHYIRQCLIVARTTRGEAQAREIPPTDFPPVQPT